MKENKYNWKKYVRDYRLKSIFVKNLLMMFLVVLLPIICVVAILNFSYINSRENEKKVYSERITEQIVSNTEQMLEQTRGTIFQISADNDFTLFLLAERNQETIFYDTQYMHRFLTALINSSECVDDIYVYAAKSNQVFSKAGIREYDNFHDIPVIEQMLEEGEPYQLKFLNRELPGKKQKGTLSMCYKTKLGGDGIIIVNLDIAKIKRQFKYGEGVSYKLLKEDEILFSTKTEECGTKQDTSANDRKGGTVTSRKLTGDKLELICMIEETNLRSEISDTFRMLIFVIFVVCLLIVAVSIYISLRMTSPIEEILSVIESVNFGSLKEEEYKEENEVTYIIRSIYSTMEKNIGFEQELKRRAILLKKAQEVALQSQINPHFMNNTLETINRMATLRMGENNEISEMVTDLAKIMKMALDSSEVFVSLKEEIHFARIYLKIQEKRYADRFRVTWKVPEELLGCKTIKMILQPILENALQHGIFPYDDMGEIEIEARKYGESVQISITDSGFGMTQNELQKVRMEMKENILRESRHIGLNNVNQRINLAYGSDYGISIHSEPAQGTTVILSMPYLIETE